MRIFKGLVLLAVLAAAAVAATYWRYRSLDPCDWMALDLTSESGLPEMMVRAKIRGEFLLEGVMEPGPGQCLIKWWRLRSEGLGRKEEGQRETGQGGPS